TTASQERMTHEEFLAREERRAYGRASRIFRVLFWVHQVLFGLPSAVIGIDLLDRDFVTGAGTTTLGLIPVIGLFLAWIGGTLLWGLASLLHHPLLSLKTSEQGAIREKTSSWVTS